MTDDQEDGAQARIGGRRNEGSWSGRFEIDYIIERARNVSEFKIRLLCCPWISRSIRQSALLDHAAWQGRSCVAERRMKLLQS